MSKGRNIHPDFLFLLEFKESALISLFKDLRQYIFEIYPDCNEILYNTHALTSVFSISEKVSDAFCTIPIYTQHLNLAFNKGTLINDPHKLLTGTGKLMRHVPITATTDYRNRKVKDLVKSAIEFAIKDMESPTKSTGKIISKIGKKS